MLRKNNPTILIYEKYKERHDSSKHGKFLGPQELLTYLAMWRNPRDILENVIQEYDIQFNVSILLDKNGQFITVL